MEKINNITKPLVTIIIPVYNGEDYLEEAIQSALNQTYENVEVVIVNDGSTDKTENIALMYKDKVRYFKKENGGVSSALNLGIQEMNGDYFSWLSHDDLYFKDKLKIQIKELEKHQYKYRIITGNSDFINEKGEKISSKRSKKTKILTSKAFYKKNIFKTPNGCGFLIHKDVLKSVGAFNENFRFIQDADYWYRIAHKNFGVIDLRQSVVKSRIHPKQATVYLKNKFSNEVDKMLNKETEKVIYSSNKIELIELLFLRLSLSGNKKLRRETYLNYKKLHKMKLKFKLKYSFNVILGTVIYWLKQIKRKYINLRHR